MLQTACIMPNKMTKEWFKPIIQWFGMLTTRLRAEYNGTWSFNMLKIEIKANNGLNLEHTNGFVIAPICGKLVNYKIQIMSKHKPWMLKWIRAKMNWFHKRDKLKHTAPNRFAWAEWYDQIFMYWEPSTINLHIKPSNKKNGTK